MLPAVLAAVAAWVALGLLGWYVSAQKGRPAAEGVLLGLLFGPLGVLVAALLPTLPRAGDEGEADPEPERIDWERLAGPGGA
jgi:hypothetical protein